MIGNVPYQYHVPYVSKALITYVTAAVTVGAMDWNRLVGIGSSEHVVGRLNVRSLDTQLSVRGVKEENDAVGLLHAELVTHVFREGSNVGSAKLFAYSCHFVSKK